MSRKPKHISDYWRERFRLIPGYDCVATAGDCWFDEETASKACGFINAHMTHIEGDKAGEPFNLQPWQEGVVGCVFGWKRLDGKRRYREVFQYLPRKNGKTTFLAAICNLVAFCDGEPGAEMFCAAASSAQAELLFRQAKGMIENNPALKNRCKIFNYYKTIEYQGSNVLRVLSREAGNVHGRNPHFVVIDEVHMHKSRDLCDALTTAVGARSQPLVWFITTADYDRASICNEKYDYACKVRDGVFSQESFLPVIFEASRDDDWFSPATWKRANPNLGVSISPEFLASEADKAKQQPAYLNTFLRYYLNVKTANDQAFIKMDDWDANGAPVDLESLKGRECYIGLDLSSRVDLTAWVAIFPPTADGEKWAIAPRFYVPAPRAWEKEKTDRVPYSQWEREGLVSLTTGREVGMEGCIDYDRIIADVMSFAEQYKVREIAADPWNSEAILHQLSLAGFNVVRFAQTIKNFNEPVKELERLYRTRQLAHGGNPVLRWMASNVKVLTDSSGNQRPTKGKSNEMIDGIVALLMALGRAILGRNESQGSVYETRDMIVL